MKKWWKLRNRWQKALVVLALLAVLGAPVAYVGGKYALNRRAQGWRQDGIAASQAGDHERAATLLARYVRRNPRDAEALGYYVASRQHAELPNGQHLAEALNALKLLVSMEPDRLEYQQQLLELLVKLDRRPEALDTANAILKKDKNNAKALELKTEIHFRLGQDQQALETSEKWLPVAKDPLKPRMAWLAARERLKHPRQAILEDTKKLQEAHPGDPRYELLLGMAYGLVQEQQEAVKWLKAAAARPGLSDELISALVTQFDALGMSEEGLSTLQDLVKRGAGGEARNTLAKRLWERARWAQVTEMLAGLDLKDPKADASLIAFRAMAQAAQNNKADADACRAALAGRKSAAGRAWTLLLRRTIDAADVDNKEVVTQCRSALALDGGNSYLLYFLGDAFSRLGETDLAIGAWQGATDQNPGWSLPATQAVEALLRKGRPDQALSVVRASPALIRPTNASAAVTLARAWAAAVQSGAVADSGDLLGLINQIQEKAPGEDRSLLLAIQVNAQQGNKEAAAQMARTALARNPVPSESVLLGIAAVSRKAGLGLEADCFSKSEKAHGVTPLLALTRAVDAAFAGKREDGTKLFDELATRAGKPQDLPWQVARARYLEAVASPDARTAWIQLGDQNPKDLQIQQLAASARSVQGDWEFQSRTVERLRELTGENGLAWRLAKARLLVLSPRNIDDVEAGSVLLNKLVQQYPGLPEPRVLLARALVQMNRLDGAITHLTTAAKADPTSVPIALQLAALHQSRGDYQRVRDELDRVIPGLRNSGERRAAAEALARSGREAEAIHMLEKLKADAPSPAGDLALAVLYARQRDWTKAEAEYKALLAKPDLNVIRQATAYYLSRGKRDEANRVLKQLDSLELAPAVREAVLGEFAARSGDLAGAVEQYRAATRAAPKNATLWRVLLQLQLEAGKVDDALTTLDAALAAVPDSKELAALHREAAVLREAMAEPALRPVVTTVVLDPLGAGPSLELIRIVLDGQRAGDRERLASTLQQFIGQHPTLLSAHLQLARCYELMGRPADALSTAQRAASSFPNDARPLELAARLCAAKERWSEALSYAQAWRSRSLANPEPADVFIARVSIAQKRPADAVQVLRPYADLFRSEPNRHADALVAYAAALGNTGQAVTAAELLWPLAQKDALWRFRWLQVAMQFADGKMAADWLDRVAALISADGAHERTVLAEAYEVLGRRLDNDPTLLARSAELLQANLADPKISGTLVLAAANSADRAGKLQEAEALYRRALTVDPSLWVAQNNLAMLILKRNGDASEAVALATSAVRSQPSMAALHDTLGQAQARAGAYLASADAMRAATRLEPHNPKWRIRLAQSLLDGGDLVEAGRVVSALDALHLESQLEPKMQQQLTAVRARLRTRK